MIEGRLWLDGGGADGLGRERLEVEDPATEEVVGTVPDGTPPDVDRAVASSLRAFAEWRWTSANERAEALHRAATRTEERAPELCELLCREQGKPLPEQQEELEWTASTLRYYAELGRDGRGRLIPSPEPRTQLSLVVKEPYGVVGAIVPWNYPLLLLAWKLAPALAAGNTVVVKPSELTPLATLEWVSTCLDHLPPGVVNVVTGGPVAGEALVAHPDVPVVAMTGSVATGQRIAAVAAPMMKHLHLELGGKDAFVVGPDADPGAAVEALTYAALINSGQVCTSAERVYVPSALHDEVVDGLSAAVARLRLGPGIEPGTDMGPMRTERFRARVEAHVGDAVERGARVAHGGRRPPALERGWFYEPTVLTGVDHGMVIMRDETFGPTIPVMSYGSFDEAIALANDSPLGLGATLRSSDPALVKRFFEEVRAGTVWVNDPLTDNHAGPFGGMGMTGGGRELGREGLESFQQTKHVHWDMSESPKDWWFPY